MKSVLVILFIRKVNFNSLKLVTWYLDQVVILVCISLSFIKVNYIILHKMSLLAAGKDLSDNLAARWRVEVGGWNRGLGFQ